MYPYPDTNFRNAVGIFRNNEAQQRYPEALSQDTPMFAPSSPPPPPGPRRRKVRQRVRQRLAPSAPVLLAPSRPQHTRLWELSLRLVANGALTAVAAVSLGHLVAHNQQQAEKLQYVTAELERTEHHTRQLKASFSRYFDPWQAEDLIREQSGYKSSTNRSIVWTAPLPELE